MTCMNYPECGCPDDRDCIDAPRRGCWPVIFWAIVGWAVILGIGWYFFTSTARAHDAMPTAAQPEGWKYPFSCCSGYDCRRVGDHAPLPSNEAAGVFITEKVEGFVVSSSGELVAHNDPRIKESPDGQFHWCSVAGASDGRTICLYVPPRSF